ncbi:MAG TPA: alpha/beta fold hydrolase [Acidimicrobiales bacterium]|nr:alpha/beta fold hydrolase [Acidimicrobiales bacterium]
MDWEQVTTARGIASRVLVGGSGQPMLFLHSATGHTGMLPFLDQLCGIARVYAPEWPGFGESGGEEQLEDMLDFTLHGWDIADALGLERVALSGHSMGAMIAAEMACLCPDRVTGLGLIAPAGLWLDDHPVPDIFATLPQELPGLLFADPAQGAAVLTGGTDFSSDTALTEFFVGNARRLGTAGKILFPIPNRRLSKRLYRLRARTTLVWGEEDRLYPAAYAKRWAELVPASQDVLVPRAGHMVPAEAPDAVVAALAELVSP